MKIFIKKKKKKKKKKMLEVKENAWKNAFKNWKFLKIQPNNADAYIPVFHYIQITHFIPTLDTTTKFVKWQFDCHETFV